nr:MAG TPA: hypothetical protein [Bacteriophage sp.]
MHQFSFQSLYQIGNISAPYEQHQSHLAHP